MAGRTVLRKIITTAAAAKPAGPYNQAVVADNTMYISGQVGMDPTTSKLVEGGVLEEADRVMKNIQAILDAAGATMNNVIKTTVLLSDIKDWPKVNEVYAKYFAANFPARAAYAVKDLPLGAKVEIEAIAVIGDIKEQE